MAPQIPTITPPDLRQGSEAAREVQADSSSPAHATAQSFAEEQGPNVVLLMGVVLFVLACVSFFAGNLTITALLALGGVVTVVIATGLARLEVLKLEVLKLVGLIAKFREGG